MIKSTFFLAKSNSIKFSFDIDKSLERLLIINEKDAEDLRDLISIVDPNLFIIKNVCTWLFNILHIFSFFKDVKIWSEGVRVGHEIN